jgi:hypothetical protein
LRRSSAGKEGNKVNDGGVGGELDSAELTLGELVKERGERGDRRPSVR